MFLYTTYAITFQIMAHLWNLGYSCQDIIVNVFRVCKTHDMPEFLKLEYIKVVILYFYDTTMILLYWKNADEK